MKKIIIFTMLSLSFHLFAQDAEDVSTDSLSSEPLTPTKLWCIVYFKEKPNLKLILEAESVGAVARKSEPFLTLRGRVLDSREFDDINLYIVKASACTSDLELAKKTRDEKNKIASKQSEMPTPDKNKTLENKDRPAQKEVKKQVAIGPSKSIKKTSEPSKENSKAKEELLKHRVDGDQGIVWDYKK